MGLLGVSMPELRGDAPSSVIAGSNAATAPAPASVAATTARFEGVTRRRRSASLIEYMVLLVIQLALVTVIMVAIGAWVNSKWSALNSALP
jgi:Flp pilus assembly pilin Flp